MNDTKIMYDYGVINNVGCVKIITLIKVFACLFMLSDLSRRHSTIFGQRWCNITSHPHLGICAQTYGIEHAVQSTQWQLCDLCFGWINQSLGHQYKYDYILYIDHVYMFYDRVMKGWMQFILNDKCFVKIFNIMNWSNICQLLNLWWC